jgi:hypothetical protein
MMLTAAGIEVALGASLERPAEAGPTTT